MDKKYVVILGSQGMLGRIVYKFLNNNHDFICIPTLKSPIEGYQYFNAERTDYSWKKLRSKYLKIDFVINCIAKLKNYPDGRKITENEYHKINTELPNYFDKKAFTENFRFLHISTDSVFAPDQGAVDEYTRPRPLDIYDHSKYAGETSGNNSLTIRTSLIGFDPKGKKGLIESLIYSKKEVTGYSNQMWSGASVLQVSKLLKWLTTDNNFKIIRLKTPVLHYAPLGPISKYDLIKIISTTYKISQNIYKGESQKNISRYLTSNYKQLLPKYLNDNRMLPVLYDLLTFDNNP